MMVKTPAICLRYYPFSNTSRLVQWMTPEAGRMVTLVKGSQRTRGGYLGQYDLFYTCELVYYVRVNSSVQIARECSPLKMRVALRSKWKACAAASYFCDAFSRILPPQASQSNLFDFLDEALDAVSVHDGSPELIFRFELRLLDQLGLAPRLEHCATCRKPIVENVETCFFSPAKGGVICQACRRRDDHTCMNLTWSTWNVLRSWQRERWPSIQPPPPLPPSGRLEMEDLLGQFLSYHLDVALPSRAIALDVTSRRPRVH